MKQVIGEMDESTRALGGICASGTKIPGMDAGGTLIGEESIMISAGSVVGDTARSIPGAENPVSARTMVPGSVMPWSRESPGTCPITGELRYFRRNPGPAPPAAVHA